MTNIRHLGSWHQNAKHDFLKKKLSNLELWCLLTTHRKLCNWAYQRTHYWIPKIDMSFFSAEGGPILIKFRRLVQNDVDCDDVVEIETRCIIPIWRTFGRIQWHVIPEPRITLRGAATWWIHSHDSRATCHIAGCKNSIRHIENRISAYLFIFVFNAV